MKFCREGCELVQGFDIVPTTSSTLTTSIGGSSGSSTQTPTTPGWKRKFDASENLVRAMEKRDALQDAPSKVASMKLQHESISFVRKEWKELHNELKELDPNDDPVYYNKMKAVYQKLTKTIDEYTKS